MHGVLHVGWVQDAAGGYRGQMAVYAKPNGLLGAGYMAAIKPFRHLVVYPALLRTVERTWREVARQPARPRLMRRRPARGVDMQPSRLP